MSSLFVLAVDSPPAAIRGRLQRIMLEIREGYFVGKLPLKSIASVWAEIIKHNVTGIGVRTARNECGFMIMTNGTNARDVVDNYGIQLVRFKRKKWGEKSGAKSKID